MTTHLCGARSIAEPNPRHDPQPTAMTAGRSRRLVSGLQPGEGALDSKRSPTSGASRTDHGHPMVHLVCAAVDHDEDWRCKIAGIESAHDDVRSQGRAITRRNNKFSARGRNVGSCSCGKTRRRVRRSRGQPGTDHRPLEAPVLEFASGGWLITGSGVSRISTSPPRIWTDLPCEAGWPKRSTQSSGRRNPRGGE
jgi:hypothetical protein